MTFEAHLTQFVEQFHAALSAQLHHAPDHPEVKATFDTAFSTITELLEQRSPIVLTFVRGRVQFLEKPLGGPQKLAQSLAKALESRGVMGLAFHQGFDPDELQTIFFALQLKPQRLGEMGGLEGLLPADCNLRILGGASHPDSGREPAPDSEHRPSPEAEGAPGTATLKVSFQDINAGLPEPPPPPTATALAADLRSLFGATLQMTKLPPQPGPRSPWSLEQREALKRAGLMVPDLRSLAGCGSQLALGRLDAVTLREALRGALAGLDPLDQGAVLLGIHTFPAEEQALNRALDYLAPELLAQALATVHLRLKPSVFELALLAAAFLRCSRDRELSLEAIRGRLQFEGWTIQDVDALREAILWECHGTDTKVRLGLMDRSLFELDPHQVMILNRQLVGRGRMEDIRNLMNQLDTGFASPRVERRRQAMSILADLAECLDEPGLPGDFETRMCTLLHGHMSLENDEQSVLWSCQAMEALLSHWIRCAAFEPVYRELLALGEYILPKSGLPFWKVQAIQDMLARMSGPLNLAVMAPHLHVRDVEMATRQLHALLALMGRPAASYLVVCLELEENANRRSHIVAALRAIGRHAVPALKGALSSEDPSIALCAVQLLGESGHKPALPDVAMALKHSDGMVRKAAVAAVAQLGASGAAEILSEVLLKPDFGVQMECLAALGNLKATVAVPAITELIRTAKNSGEDAQRLRLRAVETLGLLASPGGIEPLRELFRKKGFLGSRESSAIRMAAAKSLAAIPAREAREALAMALDDESDEEVRAVLRQFLVSGRS